MPFRGTNLGRCFRKGTASSRPRGGEQLRGARPVHRVPASAAALGRSDRGSSAILGRGAGLAGAAGTARPRGAKPRPGSARPINGRVPHAAAPYMPSVGAGAGRESVAARLTGQGRARRGGRPGSRRPASPGRCLSAAAAGGRADSGSGDAARPPCLCLSLPAAGPSSAPSLAPPPFSPPAPAPVSAGAPGGEEGPGAASRCPRPPPPHAARPAAGSPPRGDVSAAAAGISGARPPPPRTEDAARAAAGSDSGSGGRQPLLGSGQRRRREMTSRHQADWIPYR